MPHTRHGKVQRQPLHIGDMHVAAPVARPAQGGPQPQVGGGGGGVDRGGRGEGGDLQPAVVECCLPAGCPRLKGDPIHQADPGDAVKVFCNNEACTEGIWMHSDCFAEWEQHVLAYLRSCGRARSWSEKQRLQNLWTKKGYDLAFKACDCKCSKGHLRKDLDYIQPPKMMDKKQKKHRKKSTDKPMPPLNGRGGGGGGGGTGPTGGSVSHGGSPNAGGGAVMAVTGDPTKAVGGPVGPLVAQCVIPKVVNHIRPQLRVRTSSFSSTGSSPPSSAGTPPLTPGSAKKGLKFDFFADTEQAAAGNIFRRRSDFSVFNVLPRHQQNPYHIKMEDEGPHGNDETRCFVLTNLSTHQVTCVSCVVCNSDLPVFDKYPLIDGTFFLSPQRYNTDLQVLSEHRMLYMNAICMRCLSGARDLRCRACRTRWVGSMLVIGTMYSYDIFAAMPCCAQRLSCRNCRRPILDPGCAFQFFSEYSKAIQCPHCQANDHHFIKPLAETYVIKQPIRLY